MSKRRIIVIENGRPVHPEDQVPAEVLAAMRAVFDERVSLAEALGPTPEQRASRAQRFAEFLASRAMREES